MHAPALLQIEHILYTKYTLTQTNMATNPRNSRLHLSILTRNPSQTSQTYNKAKQSSNTQQHSKTSMITFINFMPPKNEPSYSSLNEININENIDKSMTFSQIS